MDEPKRFRNNMIYEKMTLIIGWLCLTAYQPLYVI